MRAEVNANDIVESLVGYFYYCTWVLGQSVAPADGERVIDLLLAGADAAGRNIGRADVTANTGEQR